MPGAGIYLPSATYGTKSSIYICRVARAVDFCVILIRTLVWHLLHVFRLHFWKCLGTN